MNHICLQSHNSGIFMLGITSLVIHNSEINNQCHIVRLDYWLQPAPLCCRKQELSALTDSTVLGQCSPVFCWTWISKTENLENLKIKNSTEPHWQCFSHHGLLVWLKDEGVPWCNCALELEAERIQLESNLIACNSYKCAYTAKRISDQFEEEYVEYNIKDKMDNNIRDNVAKIANAFSVCFPSEQENDDKQDYLDDVKALAWLDLGRLDLQ